MAGTVHSGLMKMNPQTPTPFFKSHWEQRKFGLTMGIMFPLVFWLVLPTIFGHDRTEWSLYVGGIFLAFAAIFPLALKPVQVVWGKVGHVLGAINSRIILGVIYTILFIPMGLLFKIMGKDLIDTKIDKSMKTYKVKSDADTLIERMEKPY